MFETSALYCGLFFSHNGTLARSGRSSARQRKRARRLLDTADEPLSLTCFTRRSPVASVTHPRRASKTSRQPLTVSLAITINDESYDVSPIAHALDGCKSYRQEKVTG